MNKNQNNSSKENNEEEILNNKNKPLVIEQKENKKAANNNYRNKKYRKNLFKTELQNGAEEPKNIKNLLPISNEISNNEKNKEKKVLLKNLKQKEDNIIKEINNVKNQKNEMGEISYNNISKAKIDDTLHNNKIKNLNDLEVNLIDKLNEIKRQINDITKNNNYSPNKNKTRFYLKSNSNSSNSNSNNVNINNYNSSINKVQLLEQNEIRLMEIEKEYKNKQKELLELEEKTKNQKIKDLLEQRKEEKKIIKRRKKEGDEMMENIKKNTQPPPDSKNCLYYKMEQNYQENEKQLLQKVKTERKAKNLYYKQNVDLETIKNDLQNFKNVQMQRASEQANNMKKVWHSRSMILKQYETPVMKTIKEIEIDQANNGKMIKFAKKGLFLDRKIYSIKKVHLPPIDEKLKQDMIKKQIDIKTLKGKERIDFINEKYMQKGFKIRNINQDLDYGKKYVFGKKKNTIKNKILYNENGNLQNHQKNLASSFSTNEFSSNNHKNIIINKNNNEKLNNAMVSSADKIRLTKDPKKINYLEEFKNIKIPQYHKWNKFIIKKDIEKYDAEGVQHINSQIESLDEKVNMGKELMKVKGGYENNVEFGNKLNSMLVDSIKGKLAIIKEVYNDKKK